MLTTQKEFIESEKAWAVIDSNPDSFAVVVNPNIVKNELDGKLSKEDIEYANHKVWRNIEHSLIVRNLDHHCDGVCCANVKSKEPFNSKPAGSIDADVMVINKQPTQYECCVGTTFSDEVGMFLTVILNKLGEHGRSVYFTDTIKCCTNNLDEASFNCCINNYLKKEIANINPKLIICNGLSVLNVLVRQNIIIGLPEKPEYGIVYSAKTYTGHKLKIMAMFNLRSVFQSKEENYKRNKGLLWQQIKAGFDSIQESKQKAGD